MLRVGTLHLPPHHHLLLLGACGDLHVADVGAGGQAGAENVGAYLAVVDHGAHAVLLRVAGRAGEPHLGGVLLGLQAEHLLFGPGVVAARTAALHAPLQPAQGDVVLPRQVYLLRFALVVRQLHRCAERGHQLDLFPQVVGAVAGRLAGQAGQSVLVVALQDVGQEDDAVGVFLVVVYFVVDHLQAGGFAADVLDHFIVGHALRRLVAHHIPLSVGEAFHALRSAAIVARRLFLTAPVDGGFHVPLVVVHPHLHGAGVGLHQDAPGFRLVVGDGIGTVGLHLYVALGLHIDGHGVGTAVRGPVAERHVHLAVRLVGVAHRAGLRAVVGRAGLVAVLVVIRVKAIVLVVP